MDDQMDRGSRTLVLRTVFGALLTGAVGVVMAHAVLRVLGAVSMPSFAELLLPVRVAEQMGRLPGWMVAYPEARGVIGALVVFCLLLLVVLLLQMNPAWRSRRLLTLPGIGKLLLATFLLALLSFLVIWSGSDLSGKLSGGESLGFQAAQSLGLLGVAGRLVIAAASGAALFAVVSDQGIGADPSAWRNPEFDPGKLAGALLRGCAAGILLALLAALVAGYHDLLFRALFSFLGGAAEPTARGWLWAQAGLSVGLGLLGAAGGGLLVALAPAPVSLGRRAGALVVFLVPAVALVIAGTWFRGYCMERGEMRFSTLTAAAGLEPEPAARLMALPGAKAPEVIVYPMAAEILASGLNSTERSVGATPANYARLVSYLASHRGRWTAHSASAWMALGAIQDRLLKPEEGLAGHLAAAEEGGVLLSSMLAIARASAMPLGPTVQKAGQAFLDPARFRTSGKGKARLARIAQNLDRMEQARALWKEALAAGYKPDPKQPDPTVALTRDGVVWGKVRADGQSVVGLRVVLFLAPESAPPKGLPGMRRLMAATTTDEAGGFAFHGLVPRVYHLGILLPENMGREPGRVRVSGDLGLYDLTRARIVDAGTITLARP